MKKCIFVFGLFIGTVLLGESVEYTRLLAYMMDYLGMQRERAQIVLEGIYDGITDAYKYNSQIKINAIEMVALLEVESSGKNIMGDNGHAVGYFQLHWEAIWFVWSYFSHLKRPEFKRQPLKIFLYFPYTQARLATLYLYLLKLQFGPDAYSAYNGWNNAYAKKVQTTINKITNYINTH